MKQSAGDAIVDAPTLSGASDPAAGSAGEGSAPRRRKTRKQRRRARSKRAGAPSKAPKSKAPKSKAPKSPPPEPEASRALGARQARRRRAERRRFWRVVMPSVGLVFVLLVGIGAWIRSSTDDDAQAASPSGGGAATNVSGPLLLAHRGADGRADLLALVAEEGSDASVLMIPTATQVEVPSLGLQALGDLPNQGDTDLLEVTVENLLGVDVDRTVLLDDDQLVEALEPAEKIPVVLHKAVTDASDTGPVLPAGPHALDAATAAGLLTTAQPGSELDRLVTVQDVLVGWFKRLRKPSIARDTEAVQPELSVLVDAANADDRRIDSLPVESVASGGGERFEVRRDDLASYVRAAFGHSLLGPAGKRPRVEILNGTGAVGVAQATAAKVVPAGAEVTLTGNVPRFGLQTTQVVYYRDADRKAAERLLDALGCGVLKKETKPINVVDVTILVGADCPAIGAPPPPG